MKKLVCLVLAFVLCLMMASTAMAVMVNGEHANGTTKVEIDLQPVLDPPSKATAPYDEDYEYGATRINQYINNAYPNVVFTRKMYVATIKTPNAAEGYYKLQIPYDVFGGDFNARLYYAEYDANYTENQDVYANWETKGVETGSYGGGKGLTANVYFKKNGSTPVMIVWRNADSGSGGAIVDPSMTGGSAEASNMPQTGDESNMMLWAALAMMSVAGLGLMLRKREAA